MTGIPETITRDELAEALRGLKITPEDENTFYPAVADAIFEKAKRSREPEYEPGSMYCCARGDVWQFIGGEWETPGVSGSVPFTVPARPLRKLVPELALTGKALHGAILEELDDKAGLARGDCVDLAWSICKMLGVERP